MIVIQSPKINVEGEEIIISSDVIIGGEQKTLWYRLSKKYKKFLVVERADAFVIGLLPLALKFGYNIQLEGVLSARLHYTLNHYLINALCLANPNFKQIKIYASGLDNKNLNTAEVAGTGLSCGVDSFATYYDHKHEEPPFNIEYFTFFNVGSHGDFGGEKAREIFNQRLEIVKDFADKVNKEVIAVDSNLSEILKCNFQKTHTLRSISCVLLLQNLFKNYYYASSVRFDQFKLDKVRIAEYDLLNLQMLSTESTNFFSSVSQFNRIERLVIIAKEPDTYSFLDVCTNPAHQGLKINCSRCKKCVQTMITLEALGDLHKYESVFEIANYFKFKSRYLGYLLIKTNRETLDIQLLRLIKDRKLKVPSKSYYYGLQYYLMKKKKTVKNKLKL